MTVDALYAYAVVPEDAPVPSGAPAILPGARHALIAGGGCAALVSPVPREPFQPGPAGRLGDADWLAERARAHRGAIAAAAACGPVLPLAFGAIFSGAQPLVAWLDLRGPRLRAALQGGEGEDLTYDIPRDLTRDLARRMEAQARLLRPSLAALAEEPDLQALRAEMARIRRELASPLLATRIAGA